jgi:hypothetical protein
VIPSVPDDQSGISDALRRAVESTFAATSDQAGDTRERAGELLDEVAKRGREASADVVSRVAEELRSISERLAKLEASLRGGGKP